MLVVSTKALVGNVVVVVVELAGVVVSGPNVVDLCSARAKQLCSRSGSA